MARDNPDYDRDEPQGVGHTIGEAIMFLLSSGGLLLNMLVLYILLVRIRLIRIDTLLSVLITVFDLSLFLMLMVRLVYKWAIDSMGVMSNYTFCRITGTIFFSSVITSLDIVSILSLVRCLIIVFKIYLKPYIWTTIVFILIAFNWVSSGIRKSSYREISWGKFCPPVEKTPADTEYYLGLLVTAKTLVTFIVLCGCYILIYLYYNHYFNNMFKNENQDEEVLIQIRNQKRAMNWKFLGLLISYLILYLPKIVLLSLLYTTAYMNDEMTWEMISSVTISATGIANASVILFIQEETKQEWQILMTLGFYKLKSKTNVVTGY